MRAAWLQSSLHITGLHSYQTDASPFFHSTDIFIFSAYFEDWAVMCFDSWGYRRYQNED